MKSIVLAGQSNAEGNGVSLDTKPFVMHDDFEIIDKNKYGMKLKEDGSYGGLNFVYPVETIIRELQERKNDDGIMSCFRLSRIRKNRVISLGL